MGGERKAAKKQAPQAGEAQGAKEGKKGGTNDGDTLDHVLDERADRAEAGEVLAATVPDREGDGVGTLLLVLRETESGGRAGAVSSGLLARSTTRAQADAQAGCPC